MDFLKKNYEKVLLGVVLLGLVAGAVFLLLLVPQERQALKSKADEIVKKQAKPLPDLELARTETLLKRAGGSDCLDLNATNKVFNPMQWQRKAAPDNSVFKVALGNEVGPEAVVVTKILPLYLTITLENVETIGANLYYVITVEREAATKASDRRKKYSALPNTKNEIFIIREIRGEPGSPTEIVLELNDGGERVSVAKDKPFKRVDGYVADFKYPPDNKTWTNQRVGAGGPGTTQIMIAGEAYIVVAIQKNEVVLSAKSNNKKTPRPFPPAP